MNKLPAPNNENAVENSTQDEKRETDVFDPREYGFTVVIDKPFRNHEKEA